MAGQLNLTAEAEEDIATGLWEARKESLHSGPFGVDLGEFGVSGFGFGFEEGPVI